MAETGDRTDPIQAFRFTVSFDDLPVAGFTEVSGLDVEIEILEHVEGGLNDHVHRLPTRAKTGTLTLKRGIVDSRVWDWCWDTVQGRNEIGRATCRERVCRGVECTVADG